MPKITGYAASNSHSELKPYSIIRKEPADNEVAIDILYCGVCHSDIHQARNEWKNTVYPCMPGHEIVGRVSKAGSKVTKFKANDIVGVGCMIDSCLECESCKQGLEQYCTQGFTSTYNGNIRHPSKKNLTYGGYSTSIVVREDFVLSIPENLDPAAAAPLLCAGITSFSPLQHWKVGRGIRVGVVGMGGLGHVAIKLAIAMGAEVTLITTSLAKTEAAKDYGVSHIIISTDKSAMESHTESLDFILSTIPQPHDVNPYIGLLKRDGVLTIVGCIAPLKGSLDLSKMIPFRKSLGTSLIGGIKETQEMLDFCGTHSIGAEIQLIPINQINEAFASINEGEVRFRYVIEMSSLAGKKEQGSFDKIRSLFKP